MRFGICLPPSKPMTCLESFNDRISSNAVVSPSSVSCCSRELIVSNEALRSESCSWKDGLKRGFPFVVYCLKRGLDASQWSSRKGDEWKRSRVSFSQVFVLERMAHQVTNEDGHSRRSKLVTDHFANNHST